MRKLLNYADKLVLAACVVLFLGSAVWATLSFRRVDAVNELNATATFTPAPQETRTVQMPTITQVSWPEPPTQTRGWLYDTFTPPVVYYDPRTREFTVTRPELNTQVAATTETPFEVELVTVKQEPYRIQLVGYAGSENDYLAHLEIVETGAVVLGRPGTVYPENKGDFTLRSFEVRRETTTSEDSMPVVQNVGAAVILDGRTGREMTLTTRERVMLPRLQCVLRTRVYPPEEHALREGMKITVNGFDYLVVQLSLNPAQAVISRKDGKAFGGETRTLRPVDESTASSGPGPTSGLRDNSIDSLTVSLFRNTRHVPSVDRGRLPSP